MEDVGEVVITHEEVVVEVAADFIPSVGDQPNLVYSKHLDKTTVPNAPELPETKRFSSDTKQFSLDSIERGGLKTTDIFVILKTQFEEHVVSHLDSRARAAIHEQREIQTAQEFRSVKATCLY